MRQDNSENPKGNNKAAPESSLLTNLSALASALAKIHPIDIMAGAHALAIFAGAEMAEENYTGGHGGTSCDEEELAETILAVLHRDAKMAGELLPDYGRLLDAVNDHCFIFAEGAAGDAAEQSAAALVCRELDRIELNLGTYPHGEAPSLNPVESYLMELSPAVMARILTRQSEGYKPERMTAAEVMPVRRAFRWFQDKAVIAAAVCLALLLWDLTSDHFPIWQLLGAIALLSGVCPLMYRIGAKHGNVQTPVGAKP
jgi:hypothetical protein